MIQVKRYVAATFAEALIQAKNELGSDAMIVESKKKRVGGILGLFGREMTELTVAVDRKEKTAAAAAAPRSGQTSGGRTRVSTAAPALAGVPNKSDKPPARSTLSRLEQEVASLRSVVDDLKQTQPADYLGTVPLINNPLCRSMKRLVSVGVEETVAADICRRLPGTDTEAALLQEVARLFGQAKPIVIQPGRRRVVALVGPTGVGKTTTLAKLAAHFALLRGKKVALVTTDTYRIAAIQQLRTYAEILGIPFYTADMPDDVLRVMEQTKACDLVLLDTAGRSHHNQERMQELQHLLRLVQPDETHLLVSLTTNPRDALATLDCYLPLGVNRLAFTKLDESSAVGLMLNMRMRCGHPVSYLTTGQSVPDDIITADGADMAKLLLEA